MNSLKIIILSFCVVLAKSFQVPDFLEKYCVNDNSRLTCSDFEFTSDQLEAIQTTNFDISDSSILVFKKCKISKFNEKFMSKFKSARFVKFEDCNMDLSTEVTYVSNHPLTSIVFKDCVIGAITKNAFWTYKELSSVSFIQVSFPQPIIAEGLFYQNDKLTQFTLMYSDIEGLNKDIFSGAKNLDSVTLNGNDFANGLDSQLFEKNIVLKTLLAADSGLSLIQGGLFPATIENIDFSFNELQSVSDDEFKGLLSLKTLDIGNNKIQSLSESAFQDLQNLESLHMEYNQIEAFSKKTFENLENLKYLNVIGNKGASDPTIFEDLSDIDELYM